jgi:hypothetical protein
VTIVAVIALTSDIERRSYTPGSLHGVVYARTMSDVDLLATARDAACAPQTDAFRALLAAMGPATNPSWITARAAETAYERGLIDEQELDWICR